MDTADFLSIFAPKTYTEGGQGRKQCPSCKQFVGCRITECACKHEFVIGEIHTEKKYEPYDVATIRFAKRMGVQKGRIVYAPVGTFTSQLVELTQNGVTRFCDNAITEYLDRERRLLHVDALKYLGSNHLKLNGDDLIKYNQYVDEWFGNLSAELVED
jgi:hypothetical protein